MKAVEINHLYFRYSNKLEYILEDINLLLNEGEITALMGMSGSGKSTLCRCICGIIPHVYKGELEGHIKVFGKNVMEMTVPEIASKVGIVFQNPETQLFSPTVEDELAFGPENLCIEREEIGLRISEALRLVNMEDYRYANPNQLSGGQKQLIAIASVLTLEPKIVICDEIMSQIDKHGKALIKKALTLLKEQGKTILLIEHNIENISIADRTLVLNNRKISKCCCD